VLYRPQGRLARSLQVGKLTAALRQLDSKAALKKIKKLYDMSVIEPCTPSPEMIKPGCLVDTTLVISGIVMASSAVDAG